jgi:hypothetical protein
MGILLSISIGALCAEEPPPSTDGRLWRQMSAGERIVFLIAYDAGAGSGADSGIPAVDPHKTDEEIGKIAGTVQNRLSPLGVLTPIEAVALIAKFYEDPLNRPIQIDDAVWIVAKQVAGKPPEEIAATVARLRQQASGASVSSSSQQATAPVTAPVDPQVQAAQIEADARVRTAEIKAQAKVLVAETEARTVREQLKAHRESEKKANGAGAYLRALGLAWVSRPRRPVVNCTTTAIGTNHYLPLTGKVE